MEKHYDLNTMRLNYKKTSDEEIKRLLKKIILVDKTHNGEGTMFGYYQLGKTLMDSIIENPRSVSHTFSSKKDHPLGDYIGNLKEVKKIVFYVKSSSRFFLKPDIGEVFDQMSEEDKASTDAIYSDVSSALGIEASNHMDIYNFISNQNKDDINQLTEILKNEYSLSNEIALEIISRFFDGDTKWFYDRFECPHGEHFVLEATLLKYSN